MKGGRQGRTHPVNPISFIFMQFSAIILPNNRFLPEIQEFVSSRLGNPGSGTVQGVSVGDPEVRAGVNANA